MSEILGIFGGTFSPPHNGHVHAAQLFLEQVKPDRLLIIPAYIPPHKEYHSEVSPSDRLAMCKLAFSDCPRTEISDMEIRRGGKSYTVCTLEELSAPGRTLAFLCGTDMMLSLDNWFRPERIFELADLYCVRREADPETEQRIERQNELYEKRFGKRVVMLAGNAYQSSSTDIRLSLHGGVDPSQLPADVAAYIREKRLYQ